MCKFQIKVILCQCKDPNCTQRASEIADDQLPEGGHAVRITQYYRIGPVCRGWFKNTGDDRIILKYGYPEWNANGTQDCCEDKKFVHNGVFERGDRMCAACGRRCVQPPEEDEGEE